jgi:hypothetical protein
MHDTIPSQLSDDNLVAAIKHLCAVERGATASMVAHLAELDARRLYLGAGFPSLFTYCCEVLGLSEHETYNRIEVARAGRKFPALLARLGDGSLNLTTARMLARHLTSENEEELLAAAAHRRKAEVEEWLAGRFPRPDVATSIRKLPAPRGMASIAAAQSGPESPQALLAPTESVSAGSPAVAGSTASGLVITPGTVWRRSVVRPLAPQRYEIRFTARAETREKLRQAQDLLRHAIPSGDPAEIIDRALSALLDQLAKKKQAATERPVVVGRTTREGSRHVPAAVKREVWRRDGGRCAFVATSGRRCAERGFLELHHVRPYGVGGEATAENLWLRCRSHNAYEADLFYVHRQAGEVGTRSGPSSPPGGVVPDRSTTRIGAGPGIP